MPLQVVPVTSVGPDKKREIVSYLTQTFRDSLTARLSQIDGKYSRWIDNYNAKPFDVIRTTPFVGASNFIPQLIRIHTDILSARINGIVCGTRPFWRPSSFNIDYRHDDMQALAKYMEMITFHRMKMFPKIDEMIQSCCKVGTTVLKARWEDTTFWMKKDLQTETPFKIEGNKLDVVPFYDFFPYPLTAPTIEDTLVSHHRLRFTKEEIEYRRNIGLWDKDAVDLVLKGGGNKVNPQEQASADEAGIGLTIDTARPYTVVESSFKYELSPGKLYNLIAVFNPHDNTDKSLLRLYHSYFSDPSLNMYVDFRLIPRDNLFYGYCIPEILEQAQEEQAHIHNSRRDANTIANTPTFKKKRYSLNNFNPASDWYPGKVFEVDNMDDIATMTGPNSYNSMIDEENFLIQLSERATGVSQPMQGMGTGSAGKRGTYASQGTLALLAEGNRRLDIYIKRLRNPFHRLGKIIYTSNRDFGDTAELAMWGDNGQRILKAFQAGSGDTPEGAAFKDLFFDFSASDAGSNKETDRSALMLMSNTAAAYYQQILGLAQQAAAVPQGSPGQAIILAVLDGARDLFDRVLTAFDVPDRKRLLVDIRALLSGGASPDGSGAPIDAGTGEPQSAVSGADLQGLSQNIAALTGAGGTGPSVQ